MNPVSSLALASDRSFAPRQGRPLTFVAPALTVPACAPAALAATTGRRERHLLLVFVACAHLAGAVGLARVQRDDRAPEIPPMMVSLIELAPLAAEPSPLPQIPAPTPEPVITPPPPVPPPPEPVALPPEPVVVPPPPKPAPKPAPKPRPAPRKVDIAPTQLSEAPTAIRSEDITPQAPAAPATPAASAPPVQAIAAAPARAQPGPVISARFDAAYLNNPKPSYPPLSRRMNEQGKVQLRVRVGADGYPQDIELHKTSGSPRLDKAAEAAVARWRFIAAQQDGRNIESWVIVPIVFELQGS